MSKPFYDHIPRYKTVFFPGIQDLNTSTSTGMVGVDLNVNHIAVANVNDIGQCVDAFTLPFNLEGKTNGQQEKIIEAEVIARQAMGFKEKLPPMEAIEKSKIDRIPHLIIGIRSFFLVKI
jgi:hypothetical protein